MLRMVPLPRWGRNDSSPPQSGLRVTIGSRRTIMLAEDRMTNHRIYSISVASVYPHYIAKAEKKGRTKAEVDEIFRWLTGYSPKELEGELARSEEHKSELKSVMRT